MSLGAGAPRAACVGSNAAGLLPRNRQSQSDDERRPPGARRQRARRRHLSCRATRDPETLPQAPCPAVGERHDRYSEIRHLTSPGGLTHEVPRDARELRGIGGRAAPQLGTLEVPFRLLLVDLALRIALESFAAMSRTRERARAATRDGACLGQRQLARDLRPPERRVEPPADRASDARAPARRRGLHHRSAPSQSRRGLPERSHRFARPRRAWAAAKTTRRAQVRLLGRRRTRVEARALALPRHSRVSSEGSAAEVA